MPESSPPTIPFRKPALWRMSRTIAPGISLLVSGSEVTLTSLLDMLELFVAQGREACAQSVPLARFLSSFRSPFRPGGGA